MVNKEIEATIIANSTDKNGDPLDDAAKEMRGVEAVKAIREKAVTTLIIRGACNRRYTSLRNHLMTEYGLKMDKTPPNIDNTMMALNNTESQVSKQSKQGRGGHGNFSFAQTNSELVPGTNERTVDHVTCHKCNKAGH